MVISRGVSQAQNGARMLTARLCRIMSSREKHGDFRPVRALGAPLISINCTGLDDNFAAFPPIFRNNNSLVSGSRSLIFDWQFILLPNYAGFSMGLLQIMAEKSRRN